MKRGVGSPSDPIQASLTLRLYIDYNSYSCQIHRETRKNYNILTKPGSCGAPKLSGAPELSCFSRSRSLHELLPKNALKILIRHAKHDCLPEIEGMTQIRQPEQQILRFKAIYQVRMRKSCAGYSHLITNPATCCRILCLITESGKPNAPDEILPVSPALSFGRGGSRDLRRFISRFPRWLRPSAKPQ